MRTHSCGRCGQRVFFENTVCEACGATLAFVPEELAFAAFEVGPDGAWQRVGPEGPYQGPGADVRLCSNYTLENVCNWTVSADAPGTLCLCCNTTHTIPALSKPENRAYWLMLEQAKRRLFYSLVSMKLPAPSKIEDPEHGLSFQFLEEVEPKEKVLTGHDEGTITLNIAEADDAKREQLRLHLHEPYRTLLGHFRHEIGHYYWDRLIHESVWIDEFRELFGDERADYGEALKKHYAAPMPNWHLSFVSSYASSHPWEDWAESWAHYMHMQDGLETAVSWGLRLSEAVPGAAPVEPLILDANVSPLRPTLVEQWLPVSQFINAMDRSLGSHDSYPFVLPEAAIAKLEFVHKVVSAASKGEVAMRFGSNAPPPADIGTTVEAAEPLAEPALAPPAELAPN